MTLEDDKVRVFREDGYQCLSAVFLGFLSSIILAHSFGTSEKETNIGLLLLGSSLTTATIALGIDCSRRREKHLIKSDY